MRKTNNYKSKNYKRNKKNGTYKKRQNKQRHIVIVGKIYADWCGYCVALKPEWAKVEKALLPIRSNEMESANKDHLVDMFNKKYRTNLQKQVGYPTIFKLEKMGGKVEIYNGERNAASMIQWLIGKEKKKKGFFGLF